MVVGGGWDGMDLEGKVGCGSWKRILGGGLIWKEIACSLEKIFFFFKRNIVLTKKGVLTRTSGVLLSRMEDGIEFFAKEKPNQLGMKIEIDNESKSSCTMI